VLREVGSNFPKHGFSYNFFNKWPHKVTFWFQVNVYPLKDLNFLSLNQLQTNAQHIAVGGGDVETIFCHRHLSSHSTFGV
jgi:hypothetical protein